MNWEEPARHLVESARQYCGLIDRIGPMGGKEFLRAIHIRLADLYAAAVALPPVPYTQVDCPPSTDSISYAALREQLQATIPTAAERYREVFNPYDPPSEAEVQGSLSNDLADIYAEVRISLACWDHGARQRAMWDLQLKFESHWGEHATGAIRALQALSAERAYDGRDLTEPAG